jgi:hypothetical protein
VLAEIQAAFRGALAAGDAGPVLQFLAGGDAAGERLKIHQRHYAASLIAALRERHPATEWLVGSDFIVAAAQEFVRLNPPKAPCIAEYGVEFPAFLAKWAGAGSVPYLRAFAELERGVGLVSIAVERPALPIQALSGRPEADLPDLQLKLQPGLHLLETSWPVDELIALYLADESPPQFMLAKTRLFIEVRGARGVFSFERLDAGAYAFRRALAEGQVLGSAAARASERDASFDLAGAFATLFAAGLVTAIIHPAGKS